MSFTDVIKAIRIGLSVYKALKASGVDVKKPVAVLLDAAVEAVGSDKTAKEVIAEQPKAE